jgi:hypothetical protein
VGSPDATPCGKRSRRSVESRGNEFDQTFFVVMANPTRKDVCRNLRRVNSIIF